MKKILVLSIMLVLCSMFVSAADTVGVNSGDDLVEDTGVIGSEPYSITRLAFNSGTGEIEVDYEVASSFVGTLTVTGAGVAWDPDAGVIDDDNLQGISSEPNIEYAINDGTRYSTSSTDGDTTRDNGFDTSFGAISLVANDKLTFYADATFGTPTATVTHTPATETFSAGQFDSATVSGGVEGGLQATSDGNGGAPEFSTIGIVLGIAVIAIVAIMVFKKKKTPEEKQ